MISLALALALSSTAPREPVWHKPDLPHAKPESAPQRIVSLAPVVTETLFALGAGDRVVGDTRFCDRPEAAAKLPHVGGYVDISLERVLELKPDLVVAMPSMGQRDVLDRLRDRGVPVFVVFGDTLAEVHGLIHTLGDVVGTDDARQKAAHIDDQLKDAESLVKGFPAPRRWRAAIVVGTDPIVVAGPGTFAADALQLAGFTLATDPKAPMWPTWSIESLVASNVQYLVAAEGPEAAAKLDALLTRAFRRSPDLKPHVLSAGRAILMRPGPALVDDLMTLGEIFRRYEDERARARQLHYEEAKKASLEHVEEQRRISPNAGDLPLTPDNFGVPPTPPSPR
jgi:iron complex transport system substrate-binding protein